MGVQVEKVERGFGQRAKRTEESGRESAGTLDHGVEGARVGLYTRKASNFTFVSTGRDYRGETEVREEGDRITVQNETDGGRWRGSARKTSLMLDSVYTLSSRS